MKLDISVAYSAYGRVEGARVNSTVGFVETVGYDIPVLDDSEAPIMVAWDDDKPDNARDAEPLQFERPQERRIRPPYHGPDHVRMHDGGYLRPLRAYEFLANEPGNTAPLDLRQFIRAIDRSETSALSRWQNPRTRKNRTPEQHFSAVETTSRRFAIRDLGKALARYCVVGDQVYVRCGQPTVTFEDQRYGRPALSIDRAGTVIIDGKLVRIWHAHTIRIMTSERDDAFATRNLVFPVQVFRDVLKRVNRLNLQREPEFRDVISDFNQARAPGFAHPELVDRLLADECALNLRRFIANVENRPERHLPPGDHRRLKLVYEITEAVRLLPSEDGFELLETAAREWLDDYGLYTDANNKEQAALKRALEIAESREVTLDASFSGPVGPSFRG